MDLNGVEGFMQTMLSHIYFHSFLRDWLELFPEEYLIVFQCLVFGLHYVLYTHQEA